MASVKKGAVVKYPKADREAGLGVEYRKNGRYTAYSRDMALQVIEDIANGGIVDEICQRKDRPVKVTFYRWLREVPELSALYDAAVEQSAMALEDQLLVQADRLMKQKGMTAVQIRAIAVAMDQLRWSASKRNPKRYGNQPPQAAAIAVQINTTLDLGGGTVDDVYDLKPISDQTRREQREESREQLSEGREQPHASARREQPPAQIHAGSPEALADPKLSMQAPATFAETGHEASRKKTREERKGLHAAPTVARHKLLTQRAKAIKLLRGLDDNNGESGDQATDDNERDTFS